MIDGLLTRWSTEDRAGMPLLVLLHGYGADEHDLFGLVPVSYTHLTLPTKA